MPLLDRFHSENPVHKKAVKKMASIIPIQLKRFHTKVGVNKKIDIPVTFPVTNLKMKDVLYDLDGIVCHRGSLNSGHYISYVKA